MWADSSVAAARLLLVATLLLLAAETTSAFAPAAGAAPAWSLHTAASGRSRRTNSSMSSSGRVGGCASNNELDMMDRIRRGLGPSRHESRQLVRGSHRHGPSSLAGERAGAAPTRAIARSGSPSRVCMSSDEHDGDSDDDNDARFPWSRSSHGNAFAAATCFRGGAASPASSSTSSGGGEDSGGIRPAIAAAVQSVDAGGTPRKNRLMIDYVEDALVTMWSHMVNVGVPVFHLGRFGFGLSLLFYGMAFRTFAFHVIVFRIAGMKQVQRAVRELVGNYANARRSIREAAKAAETVGERVVKGDDLQAARERMIEEKKRLLSDGFLSKRETIYFMKKYRAELLRIKEEQELFQSARSSVLSLRSSVGPRQARSSFNGVYNALIASFTASTIQTAGQFTLGLHIGNLLKASYLLTHVLDLFGPIIDPIGYRLDLSPYFDEEDIPYMGKANAMDGPRNMALNIFCYSVVFIVFQVHPSVALKLSMVYYGARVVTDYVVLVTEPARRKLGQMTIVHTPWSAVIHAGLTILGYCCHRNVLYTAEVPGLHPLAVGPGAVGLVEPVVRFAVKISEILSHIEFFKCKFVEDPVEMVKHMTGHRKVSVGPVEFLKKLVRRGE
ncbi:unnamed protein product [Ectocarpus sp. CCAP 1310/34]|nr:unnamed protein product [Ectocarpus sp. CCAP 1310/34]